MGQLDSAGYVSVGPGERAAADAEQLALEKCCGNAAGIDFDQRAARAPARRVKRPGESGTAGARLAEDEDRRLRAGGPIGTGEMKRKVGVEEKTGEGERRARGVHGVLISVSVPALSASAGGVRNEAVTSGASDQRRSKA